MAVQPSVWVVAALLFGPSSPAFATTTLKGATASVSPFVADHGGRPLAGPGIQVVPSVGQSLGWVSQGPDLRVLAGYPAMLAVDLQAPELTLALPATARANALVTMALSSNEPLAGPPLLRVRQSGVAPVEVGLAQKDLEGKSWEGTFRADGAYPGVAEAQAEGRDLVGYVGRATGRFMVEAGVLDALTILNVSASPDPVKTGATFSFELHRKDAAGTTATSSGIEVLDALTGVRAALLNVPSPQLPLSGSPSPTLLSLPSDLPGVPDGRYRYVVRAQGEVRKGKKVTAVTALPKEGSLTLLRAIEFPVDPSQVRNPSNAEITVEPVPPGTEGAIGVGSGAGLVSALYDIGPDGVVFTGCQTLKLNYEQGGMAEGGPEELGLKIFQYENGGWVALETKVDEKANTASACITMLSTFGVFDPARPPQSPLPPGSLDRSPPLLTAILIKDPDNQDPSMRLELKVLASEAVQEPVTASLYGHGSSGKEPAQLTLERALCGEAVYYRASLEPLSGYGDIESVLVRAKDLSGNPGASDGGFNYFNRTPNGSVILRDTRQGVLLENVRLAETNACLPLHVQAWEPGTGPAAQAGPGVRGLGPLKGFRFGPEGTTFSSPATLVLSYAGLDVQGPAEGELRCGLYDPKAQAWDPLSSTVDPKAKTVSCPIEHFSLYAILGPLVGAQAETFALGEVYAYPNPAFRRDPVFHIEAGLADEIQIRIYDVSGALVYEKTLTGPPQIIDDGQGPEYAYEHRWDVSSVGSGVYVFVLTAKKAGRPDLRTLGKAAVAK